MKIVVIDYGSGNLRSAAKALERAAAELGASSGASPEVVVTGDASALKDADHVVLPGVGAFGDCMAGLRALPGMGDALEDAVIRRARPFLGICVGMQLMATRGIEHGAFDGLGWLDGEVSPLTPSDDSLKIPHMGWNELVIGESGVRHPVLDGIEGGQHAYFVHSYAFLPAREGEDILATVDYGGPVAAVVGRDNMIGTQFHPEKSQETGLRLLGNFLRWRP